jgi:thiol:disulfide interchange protein
MKIIIYGRICLLNGKITGFTGGGVMMGDINNPNQDNNQQYDKGRENNDSRSQEHQNGDQQQYRQQEHQDSGQQQYRQQEHQDSGQQQYRQQEYQDSGQHQYRQQEYRNSGEQQYRQQYNQYQQQNQRYNQQGYQNYNDRQQIPQYQPPQYSGQSQYQQPLYTQAPKKNYAMAVASMICGIVGLSICCFWYISLPISIVGLILGILSIRNNEEGRGMAIAGITTSAITILFAVLAFLGCGIINTWFWNAVNEASYGNYYY